MDALLLLNLIIPFVMILVGGMLKKYPVTDMKSNNGYNTPTSRKSQEHWDYAQCIASGNFIFFWKGIRNHRDYAKCWDVFAAYLD